MKNHITRGNFSLYCKFVSEQANPSESCQKVYCASKSVFSATFIFELIYGHGFCCCSSETFRWNKENARPKKFSLQVSTNVQHQCIFLFRWRDIRENEKLGEFSLVCNTIVLKMFVVSNYLHGGLLRFLLILFSRSSHLFSMFLNKLLSQFVPYTKNY